MLTAINNAMVFNKKASKLYKFCVLQVVFFSLQFVGIVFVSSSFDLVSASIISSHVITELTVILAKYFPFSQLHIEEFQI